MKLKKDLMISIIFKILYSSMMVYGTIEIVAVGLSLSYSRATILFFLICFNTVIHINIKYLRIGAAILFLLLLFIFKSEMMNGFQIIANEIGALLESFYGIHLKVFNIEGESANPTLFLMLCAVILAGIKQLAIFRKQSLWLLFSPGALLIGGLMLIGIMPSAGALLLYMIGGMGTSLTFRKYQDIKLHNHVMLIISGLMVLLLVISVFVMYPLFKPSENSLYTIKREITSFYKEKNLYLYEDNAGSETLSEIAEGGLAQGDLRSIDTLRFSGKKHLEVTVDEKPKDLIYLKGYVAGNYTDNQWVPRDYTDFNELFTDNGYDLKRVQMAIWNMPANALASSNISQMMEIENLAAGNVIYPYTAKLDSDDTLSGAENVMIENWSGGTFEYYPQFYSQLDCMMDSGFYQETTEYSPEDDLHIASTEQGDIFSLYGSYVMSAYTKNDDNMMSNERWSEIDTYVNAGLMDATNGYSTGTIIRLVKSYLNETTTYSLSPGKVPDEQNFIEYFLYDNKKGFCVHYATAATIIFRYYGIPARYVEGYVISPGDFKENEDGTYTAIVKDNRAHAWSEVYSNGYGWTPVEVTPAYTEGQIPEQNRSTETTNEQQKESTDTKTESSNKETKDSSAASEIKADKTSFINLLIVILIMMTIVGLIVIRRYIIVNNRYQKIYSKDKRESICTCYEEIIKLLKFQDYEYDLSMSEETYARKVEDSFDFLEKGEFINLTKIILKSTYSRHEPTNMEKSYALKLYKKFRQEAVRKLKTARKLWLVWGKCL